jgi:Swt1-like HEPN
MQGGMALADDKPKFDREELQAFVTKKLMAPATITAALALASEMEKLTFNPKILEVANQLQRMNELAYPKIRDFQMTMERIAALPAVQHFQQKFATAQAAIAQVNFRLPEIPEAALLAQAFLRESDQANLLQRYSLEGSALQKAMAGMRYPWIDIENEVRSVTAFTKLQGIGSVVESTPAFGANLAETLRVDLGDWRDPITFTDDSDDLLKRASLYTDLGFDRSLTDFPAPAFEESLDLAGLRRNPPTLVAIYVSTIDSTNEGDQEEALERTNVAHKLLLRLETQLRKFIDEQMTSAAGPNWPKHHLPNNVYDRWTTKKAAAIRNGARDQPLVAYADFTEYVPIITKRDNWKSVFATFFGREEDLREAFQRMHYIRLDTMHARPITQDDLLLLLTETRRLMKFISRK